MKNVLNIDINYLTIYGAWETLGDGVLDPIDTIMNPTYIVGTFDTLLGSVNLVLTSMHNGVLYA